MDSEGSIMAYMHSLDMDAFDRRTSPISGNYPGGGGHIYVQVCAAEKTPFFDLTRT